MCRLFGGLVSDIKRKLPWYPSDFKDGLHIQCVASVIFLYLATLTPNVTFGGLLGQATDQYMVRPSRGSRGEKVLEGQTPTVMDACRRVCVCACVRVMHVDTRKFG